MPLKLSVGTSQKIGQPDFGSLGASCSLEVELDPALLQNDLESFQRHARHAFTACRQAVRDELARHPSNGHAVPQAARPRETRAPSHGGRPQSTNGGQASAKQKKYIDQLAGQVPGLGKRKLEALCQRMYAKPLEQLNTMDASGLIDTLKAMQEGQIDPDEVLDGARA